MSALSDSFSFFLTKPNLLFFEAVVVKSSKR